MKFIAHRGLYLGRNEQHPYPENSPRLIELAFDLDFHAEIDLRYINGRLYSGHDHGDHRISEEWLYNYKDRLFCHAKDLVTAYYLFENHSQIHSFFHDNDQMALTNHGYYWQFSCSKHYHKKSIAVLPETCYPEHIPPDYVYGICSDQIAIYRNKYEICPLNQTKEYLQT